MMRQSSPSRISRLTAALLPTLLLLLAAFASPTALAGITESPRGATAESDTYRVVFRNGVVTSIFNKLTNQEYVDPYTDLANIQPHLPSGIGVVQNEQQRAAAFDIMSHPWWEFPNTSTWPNQHFADDQSQFSFTSESADKAVLTYTGLTDGSTRYADETFVLTLAIDQATGDLLITPSGSAPGPQVYGVGITVSALMPHVTIEAPIFDGVRLDRHMEPMLWHANWGSYWDYAVLALNGYKRGAIGIWAQDAELRHYKHLYHMTNDEGLSFAMSAMNIPPYDASTKADPVVTWRLQAFEHSWAEVVNRYNSWRAENVKDAKRPDWHNDIGMVVMGVNAGKMWVDIMEAYLGSENLKNTVTFGADIRRTGFDKNHTDNTPYDGFKEQMKYWHEKGPHMMAYLNPVIMWGPKPETEREHQAVKLAAEATTKWVFLPEGESKLNHFDVQHMGHPGWQQWFIDWVNEYIQDYGSHGIYHDESYKMGIDSRGLINGMTTTQGMADYFHKVQTQNPDSIHGTEHLTEVNAVGASLGIASGIHWGTAGAMRMQRINHASPISNALHSPHAVLFAFPHQSMLEMKGSSLLFHWGHNLMERRGEIAGGSLQQSRLHKGEVVPFDQWRNELWLDRMRNTTFTRLSLRPIFPVDWDADTLSYFKGGNGEDFRYEKTPWGSAFVEYKGDQRTVHYGRITGVKAAQTEGAIVGWPIYNETGPSALNPDSFYTLDPNAPRPAVTFSTNNRYTDSLYESYVSRGFINDRFGYVGVETVPSQGHIQPHDSLVLNSEKQPAAIWVNGKSVEVQPLVLRTWWEKVDGKGVRQQETAEGKWQIRFTTPADIAVMIEEPQPGVEHARANAVKRMRTRDMDLPLFDTEFVTSTMGGEGNVVGGKNSLTHAYRAGNWQYLVPIKAPDQAGTIRASVATNPRGPGLIAARVNGDKAQYLTNNEKDGRKTAAVSVINHHVEAGELALFDFDTDNHAVITFTWHPEDSSAQADGNGDNKAK